MPNITACKLTIFYYNINGLAHHECFGALSCDSADIYALTAISIICNASVYTAPCFSLLVQLPIHHVEMDNTHITFINNTHIINNGPSRVDIIRIFSLYGVSDNNIVCIDCILDNIWIIYGLQFDQFCQLNDINCINNPLLQFEHSNDIQIVYYSESMTNGTNILQNINNLIVTKKHLMIIFLQTFIYPEITFNTPLLNETDSWISIICNRYLDWGINFNLSSTQNVAITYIPSTFCKINGPINVFIFNNYGVSGNWLYLYNSTKIHLNGPDFKYVICVYIQFK